MTTTTTIGDVIHHRIGTVLDDVVDWVDRSLLWQWQWPVVFGHSFIMACVNDGGTDTPSWLLLHFFTDDLWGHMHFSLSLSTSNYSCNEATTLAAAATGHSPLGLQFLVDSNRERNSKRQRRRL